ncbi:MAG: hypothetical protein EHM28_03190 [Spirochaetaceae bacterium]|nr:MAG: hypothetical protein EHM28_03190 [Spirochaetaceae bacterium]
MQKRRWYDINSELAWFFEQIQGMQNQDRVSVVQGILTIINKANPALIEDFISNYRMDLYHHRWYDSDPYLWLIYNGLSMGGKNLTTEVVQYLKQKTQE